MEEANKEVELDDLTKSAELDDLTKSAELGAQPEIENEESTNGYLASVLGVTIRQITRYRTAKELPPAGSTKEDVIRFLFDAAQNPSSQKDLEERKLEEQVKKLEIENQIKLEKYVDRDKVVDYFRSFAEYVKSTISNELENLEAKIVCPTEYKDSNNQTIRISKKSILGLLAAFKDFE